MESGRPETTLLNTITTLLSLRFFMLRNGYTDFHVVANGDDGFIASKTGNKLVLEK